MRFCLALADERQRRAVTLHGTAQSIILMGSLQTAWLFGFLAASLKPTALIITHKFLRHLRCEEPFGV